MDPSNPTSAQHATRLGHGEAAPIMRVASLVWAAGSLLTDHMTTGLDEPDLPLGEAEVLMATRVRDGLLTTPADLRAQLNLTSAGITKRIDQVEAKGLLERRAHPSDRRSVTLHLTAEGERLADATIRAVAARMAPLADALNDADIAALESGLASLVRRLEAER